MNKNEIQIFTNEVFGEIRTLNIDGEPWFVGKDVAMVLGYGDTDQALRKHVDDEDRLTRQFNGSGQNRTMYIINESGLYSLILSSKLPSAKEFKRWITSEILPTIRKTGAYMTADVLQQALDDPDFLIGLATRLKIEKAKVAQLTIENQLMRPKADYFDELVERNTLMNFRETAKQLDVKEKAFITYLLDHKYVYRDKRGKLMPYADKNNGLFEIKECFNDKTQWSGTQTLITPKGRETFRLLMLGSSN